MKMGVRWSYRKQMHHYIEMAEIPVTDIAKRGEFYHPRKVEVYNDTQERDSS